MPAVKDPSTGKFAKAAPEEQGPDDQGALANEVDRLTAELALLKEAKASVALDGETQVISDQDVEGPQPVDVEPLRLQSKYSLRHTVSIIPTRRVYHPISGTIEPVPGVFAQFEGPQRIFDSVEEQRKWGWTDEQRELVERKVLEHEGFMKDYFPAPLSPIPERLKGYMRVKPKEVTKYCAAFGYKDGKLIQCQLAATAGRNWCSEHDPDQTRIVHGGGTTVG